MQHFQGLFFPFGLILSSLNSECVRRVFTFFYLSSSTEKERSSSSSATHEVSVRALHDPQHKNINLCQQKQTLLVIID